MTNDKFMALVDTRLDSLKELMGEKQQQYASDQDRFENFHDVAAMNQCTPAQALWGMVSKHIIATRNIALGEGPVDPEQMIEKLGDIIVYMLLLEGVLRDSGRVK